MRNTLFSLPIIHLDRVQWRRKKEVLKKSEKEGGVKSSIYPLDEKQTAIREAQTCVSAPGIGWRLVAHQGPSFSFPVQMGERWRKRMSKEDRHLYFIGLDAAMPVKLMSHLSRGRRAQMKSKRKKGVRKRARCKRNGEGWVKRQERGEREEGGSVRG